MAVCCFPKADKCDSFFPRMRCKETMWRGKEVAAVAQPPENTLRLGTVGFSKVLNLLVNISEHRGYVAFERILSVYSRIDSEFLRVKNL